MTDRIVYDHNHDGIDRRGFLKCMAWVGTGVLFTAAGGVLTSCSLSNPGSEGAAAIEGAPEALNFVQISDSHIGFDKEPNQDVTATLEQAVATINALARPPAFVLHTGDLSHLSKPEEFDTVDQVLKTIKTDQVFYVPGEHDVFNDNGKQYLERYGRGTQGGGWYSFDHSGVHFIGLVNVVNLKAGGLGILGPEQLNWLKQDLKGLSSSTPIVIFAHIPLWTVYPDWGWGTDDSAQALSYLKRFGSVTVLNGHIHQLLQKVEGNVTFHTAMSTAFPQSQPGTAPAPGPLKVPADRLRSLLGITDVNYIQGNHSLAIIDSTLQASVAMAAAMNHEAPESAQSESKKIIGSGNAIIIDNFSFKPSTLTVPVGMQVTWVNHDDTPHTVVSTDKLFASQALDTNDQFAYTFSAPSIYGYYCSIHPTMTGKIIVE
jgi:3',5'-cyclic AMP phosphodiesterase CpdA